MPRVKKNYVAMSLHDSMALRALHQHVGLSVKDVMARRREFPAFSKYSAATLYRHATKPIGGEEPIDKRTLNRGRPRKLDDRDMRKVRRSVSLLRESHGSFSSQVLQHCTGQLSHVSNSTFRRYLRRMGYGYRVTRRKGMLLRKDLRARAKWCRRVQRYQNLWTDGIAMYVDAVGFEYKTNPYAHAKSLGAREWRLATEGTRFNCTSKGRKEGKKYARFLVGIALGSGVVLCEHIPRKSNGHAFAALIDQHFSAALDRTGKTCRRFLQDGCPVQNSKKALQALARNGIKRLKIPARSPDLNPIENFFNLVRRKIKNDSFQKRIEMESKGEFAIRVTELMQNYSADSINRIIQSMPKRVQMVVKMKGTRIKY